MASSPLLGRCLPTAGAVSSQNSDLRCAISDVQLCDYAGAVSRLSRGGENTVLVPAWATYNLKEVNQVRKSWFFIHIGDQLSQANLTMAISRLAGFLSLRQVVVHLVHKSCQIEQSSAFLTITSNKSIP